MAKLNRVITLPIRASKETRQQFKAYASERGLTMATMLEVLFRAQLARDEAEAAAADAEAEETPTKPKRAKLKAVK